MFYIKPYIRRKFKPLIRGILVPDTDFDLNCCQGNQFLTK